VRRTPYEYLAKSLLLRNGVLEAAAKLSDLGYTDADLDYLRELKRKLLADRPFPYIPGGSEDELWLRAHGIYQLVRREPLALKARALVDDIALRPAVEMLLVAGLPPETVSEKILELSGTKIDVQVIQLFAHYFWNRSLMTQEAWREFLTQQGDNGYPADRYANGKELYQAYLSDSSVALWRIGLLTDLDSETVLKTLTHDTYARWQELKLEPNSTGLSLKMERLAAILLKTDEQRKMGTSAIAVALERMHRISLRVRNMPIEDARRMLEDNEEVTDINEGANVVAFRRKEEE